MSDDGFFTYLARRGWLGDGFMDLQQRDDIESLQQQRQLDSQQRATDYSRLNARIDALSRELAAVRTGLEVLGHMLVEVGGLDAAALDARLREAIAQNPAAKPVTQPVVCGNCGLTYAADQILDTPSGKLCKRCRALAP